MSLDHLLHKIRPSVEANAMQQLEPWPQYTLFASLSDGERRAKVVHCSDSSFDLTWEKLTFHARQAVAENKLEVCWLRIDWVQSVRQATLGQLKDWLKRVKRNYFRYGLALDEQFNVAFLEQELNSNAMLYGGTQYVHAVLNEKNFGIYARKRFPYFQYNFADENPIFMLDTAGVFCSTEEEPKLLYPKGRDAGRRIVERLDAEDVYGLIDRSSRYLTSQTKPEGRSYYGWHPCFDRHINTYNTLRHASTTSSMVEAWEVTKNPELHDAIQKSFTYTLNDLIKAVTLPDGSQAAFLFEHTGTEVKLGANAVCILAFSKYSELTGTEEYLPILELLALGIRYMQNPDTGQFVHVLNFPDLSVKDEFRIIYYDGEAAFGLMRLYGLTKDPRWLSMVEKAFDHFIEAEHWKAHDHWLSYCVNELTLYREEEKYYRFGIQNVAGYLSFIENRITTFPTLLELIMAAEKMVTRLRDSTQYSHLLEDLDIDKFYFALEKRAHYLLNGHFWPEYAMYFANPQRILGSFFIRHHAFRVRIDDVEHYLSGFVAYLKYLKTKGAHSSLPSDAEVSQFKKNTIGVLGYPRTPVGFVEVQRLAVECQARALNLFYLSYADIQMDGGRATGHLYDAGKWTKTVHPIPGVIDNAPANKTHQQEIYNQLSENSLMLCRPLGGKVKVSAILNNAEATKKLLISTQILGKESLFLYLENYGQVIVKPSRSNRGRSIYCVSKTNIVGSYSVATDEQVQTVSSQDLQSLFIKNFDTDWVVQQYLNSRDMNNNPFDIRVPIFRVSDTEWRVARSYARVGRGGITSNLATGGQAVEAQEFLESIYDPAVAKALFDKLQNASLVIAQVLQKHYDFPIDALGCDFAIQEGELLLFEVNSYPGLQGCLDTAVVAKVDYYDWMLNRENQSYRKPVVLGDSTNIRTDRNEILLDRLMSKEPNDYTKSIYLRKGIANPIYKMLRVEAEKQSCSIKIRRHSSVELTRNGELLAVVSPNSPELTLAARRIANNKELSKRFLQDAAIAIPEGKTFRSYRNAIAYFQSRNVPQVIKPRTGSGGRGVTSGVIDDHGFKDAWLSASQISKNIIVEDYIEGDEVRVIVLSGEVIAAVCRMPAYVLGDGTHNIEGLVKIKNEERKKNPLLKIYPISNFDYLEKISLKNMQYVPAPGEYVRLAMVSNIALGGESVGMMEYLAPSIKRLAEKAWHAIPHATQIGLDIIVKDFRADARNNAYIIEVNADPAIATLAFAAYGSSGLHLPGKLLDFVLSDSHKNSFQDNATASLKAAATDHMACKGMSFPKNWQLQPWLLRRAAYARNLIVEEINSSISVVSDGHRRVTFVQGMCGQNRVVTSQATTNKQWTKELLMEDRKSTRLNSSHVASSYAVFGLTKKTK